MIVSDEIPSIFCEFTGFIVIEYASKLFFLMQTTVESTSIASGSVKMQLTVDDTSVYDLVTAAEALVI